MAVGVERATGVRDDALLERAASGDRDAFDLLIRPRLDRLTNESRGI